MKPFSTRPERLLAALAVSLTLFVAQAQPEKRVVEGTVFYERREPVQDAAVQLKNVATLQVVSQRTDREGHYHFYGLNPDLDYEITAIKNGHRSHPAHVSKFSSKPVITVDLFLRPEGDAK